MYPKGHQYLLSPRTLLVGPLLCHQDPVPALDRRQPPTPPPSGVVEPPEPSSDQAKVKFWRDRALQAEARLQEREHQIRQQSQEILDLSWKAKVAADWTQWWEHHSHEFTPLPHRDLRPTGGEVDLAACLCR